MSNASTMSPCMQVLNLWLNCLSGTWMKWKLVLLQPKAKYLLFYSTDIEVVKTVLCVLQIACCALLNSRKVGRKGERCLFAGGYLRAAACALHPEPLVRSDALTGLCRVQKEELTLDPVKLSSNSAPDPRRWRVLVYLPWAAAKQLGPCQEEEAF